MRAPRSAHEQTGRGLTEVVWKLRELINVFACVAAVGNAEAEVKVEVLEQAPLEVMPLDHSKAVNGPIAHRELHPEFQTQTQHRESTS